MLGRKLQNQQTRGSDLSRFRSAEINQRSVGLEGALPFRQLLARIGTNQAVSISLASCPGNTLTGRCDAYAVALNYTLGQARLILGKRVDELTVFAEDMRNKNRVTDAQQIQTEQ